MSRGVLENGSFGVPVPFLDQLSPRDEKGSKKIEVLPVLRDVKVAWEFPNRLPTLKSFAVGGVNMFIHLSGTCTHPTAPGCSACTPLPSPLP